MPENRIVDKNWERNLINSKVADRLDLEAFLTYYGKLPIKMGQAQIN